LRERLALLKIAEKEEEEEKRDSILKSKVVSVERCINVRQWED